MATIRLVPYHPSFLDPFITWRQQPSALKFNPLKKMSREEAGKVLSSEGYELTDLTRFENFRWFVEAEGEVVGNVSLKNINTTMYYADIGYGVSETHQGKGIATEAVRLVIQKIFSETKLRKIMAYVQELNVPSCHVLEKLGFKREGLLREHYIINGRPENEVLFGLLKKEWSP
jgi:[ribosomal protein S5]-alanine N-acetyltransferase